jgi:hypothetical protein
MSDDSFIREVDEELREDTLKKLWQAYGLYIVGAAVAVVIGTAAWTGYDYWARGKANASGDLFSQALELAGKGDRDAAAKTLEELEKSGYGAYPVLARMRSATLLAESGDKAGAVAAFDAVAADNAVPVSIQDMARLRAAYLLVDSGSASDVAQRAEVLAADTNPLRHAAREALGLAAWKEGHTDDALKLFKQIADDDRAPQNARQRATLMVDLIGGSPPAK